MFLEIEAHPYIFRSLSTLVDSDPENSIDADNNMFPTGTCFNIGWLSHFDVDKQLEHSCVTDRNVPMILVVMVVDSLLDL